jgi:hypothetical protein
MGLPDGTNSWETKKKLPYGIDRKIWYLFVKNHELMSIVVVFRS